MNESTIVNEELSKATNMQKYFNYVEQYKRLKKAMVCGFYLEAIFIEYAILEDRLESVLRHGARWKEPVPGQYVTIERKITLLMKMVEEKKGLSRKYFSDELLQSIVDWKLCRNMLVHALLKRNLHADNLRQIAEEGLQHAKTMCNKATSFRRAVEKQCKLK